MSLRALFDSIADAIRYVTSRSNKIIASNFPNEIRAIKDNMQEVEIVPSTEDQIKEGIFSKVTVEGSTNLVPENIKKDVDIFGVTGIAESGNAEMITTVKSGSTIQYCLVKVPQLDTSGITDISDMFDNCQNLVEVPPLDVSNATNMYSMFSGCSKLTSITFIGSTKNVTKMSYLFYGCKMLTTLPLLDTSNVSEMSFMFAQCSMLTEIPLLNAEKVIYMGTGVFDNCNALESFGGLKDIGKAYTSQTTNKSQYVIYLTESPKLTYESLMNVINNLYDLNLSYNVANGGTLYTQQLRLGSQNLVKLTPEEIAIATNKGWNVS